jgi:hypothetical protein
MIFEKYDRLKHFWMHFLKIREKCEGPKKDVPLTLVERRWYMWLCLEFIRLQNGFGSDVFTCNFPNRKSFLSYDMLIREITKNSFDYTVQPKWCKNIERETNVLINIDKYNQFYAMYKIMNGCGDYPFDMTLVRRYVANSIRTDTSGKQGPHEEFYRDLLDHKIGNVMYYMYDAYCGYRYLSCPQQAISSLTLAYDDVKTSMKDMPNEVNPLLGIICKRLANIYDPSHMDYPHDYVSTGKALKYSKEAIRHGHSSEYNRIGYMLEKKGHLHKALKYYILSMKHYSADYEFTRSINQVLEKLGLDEEMLVKLSKNY